MSRGGPLGAVALRRIAIALAGIALAFAAGPFRMVGDYAYFSAPNQRTPGIDEKEKNLGRHFALTRKPIPEAHVTGDNLDPAFIKADFREGGNVVDFTIKPDAQDRFYQLTKD